MHTNNALVKLALFLSTTFLSTGLAAPTPGSVPEGADRELTRRVTPYPDALDAIWSGDTSLINGWQDEYNYTDASSLDVDVCLYDGTGAPDTPWGVLITNDNKYDTGGCGSGFLDNLRGRCGVISGWGCNYVGAQGTTAALYFETTEFCTAWESVFSLFA